MTLNLLIANTTPKKRSVELPHVDDVLSISFM